MIRDLNVAWSPAAFETAAASLIDAQKADLRQHLPDVIQKLQRLADSVGLRSTIAAADKRRSAESFSAAAMRAVGAPSRKPADRQSQHGWSEPASAFGLSSERDRVANRLGGSVASSLCKEVLKANMKHGYASGRSRVSPARTSRLHQLRQRGSFQWKQRHATSWLLTEYDDDMTDHKATKDFMKWRPDDAAKNKTRLPDRQQSVAGAATDERKAHESVAGPATDSPTLSDASVAGTTTQICYQGETPEEKPVRTASGNFATAPSRAAKSVETPRGPGAKSFGPRLRAERIARGIDSQIIADALQVDLDGLAMMEAGRVEVPVSRRRRAEAALARATSWVGVAAAEPALSRDGRWRFKIVGDPARSPACSCVMSHG